MTRRASSPCLARAFAIYLMALSFVATVGCGSGGSEVPPELLDAIRNTENQEGTGTQVGDIVENLCFDGWLDARAADFDPAAMAEICLYDFQDPEGTEIELLLVNASAVWCTSCKLEYGGTSSRPSLAEHLENFGPRGFRVLGTLFESGQDAPATPDDGAAWANLYDIDFPFAIDPTFQIGNFTTPGQAPFNMLIDARTMEILLQLEGDQPAVLYTNVESILQQRE